MPDIDLGKAFARLEAATPRRESGRVTEVTGLVIRASVPGVRIGEMVNISMSVPSKLDAALLRAEVVGFRGDESVLMPLGDVAGIGPDCAGHAHRPPVFDRRVGDALLGRVLDGLGEPIDGAGPIDGADAREWAVDRPAPDPLSRRRVTRPLPLGVRVHRRVAHRRRGAARRLFAGSGVGKSTLMGQIARNTEADVNVIAWSASAAARWSSSSRTRWAPAGRARSVVVCATSDAPSLVRLKSAFVATAIAEWFRDQGRRVLLHDGLGHPLRARPARGGPGRGRAARPPGLPAQRVRDAAAAARANRQRASAARSPRSTPCWSRAATWRSRSPTRCAASSTATSSCRASSPPGTSGPPIDVLPSLSRVMTAVADAEHRAAAAAPARAAGGLRTPARSHLARRLPARRRPAHRSRHRQDRRHQRLPAPGHPRDHAVRADEGPPARPGGRMT